MTFWEALEKEKQGSQDIDADFPDALREPVLRKCQFSQKSRLTDLVASLFSEFKDNIVAGEQVQFQDADTGARGTGQLKERTVFYDRPDLTRYFVKVLGKHGEKQCIACVDRQHIWRKPRTFTKFNLQRFLRHTIYRERYDGAPWLVKPQYASQYKLETEVPHHLTHEAMAAERRLHNGLKRNRLDDLPDTFMVHNNHIMPRPGARPSDQELQYVNERFGTAIHNGEQVLQMRPAPQNRLSAKHASESKSLPPPAPPSIKYPIEDLQLDPKRNAPSRPPLRDLTKISLFPTQEDSGSKECIEMASVGPMLEVWNTLTVFAEFFRLDGFVLDDFIGAMYITSEVVYCQLFHEIHCAALSRLVDDSGKILADTLAKAGRARDDDSSRGTSTSPSDAPDDATPSTDDDADIEMSDGMHLGASAVRHKASQMLTRGQWIELLENRQFADGGWSLIVVGLLDQLASHAKFRDRCEQILSHLAPLGRPATGATAFQQYMSMDVNLRTQALEILTILITETKPFKEHIEGLVTQSTETRKEKTSLQSQAKPLRAELSRLEQQEKLLRPDSMNGKKDTKSDSEERGDAGSPQEDDGNEQNEDEEYLRDLDGSDSDDEDMPRASRRISNRAADLKKRKRELEEEKQNQEETKELAEYRKVLREFEDKNAQKEDLDDQIQQHESELRENACHRTKVMGRDRFLNRYVWFERNGMPFEGDSQSTDYGYANGRLWVQGPDALERPGILDLDRAEEQQYHARFKMSIQGRRDREEGQSQLLDASHWGFYDNPNDIDKLISWLDAKGQREKQLKKELVNWRKPLQSCMRALKKHLDDVAEEHAKAEDRPIGIATRKKLHVDLDRTRYPCLQWENTVALSMYGQLLSAGPPPKRTKKPRGREAEGRLREGSAVPERRSTRQGGRGGR